MLNQSFFPKFGQGPFPKIAGKSPDLFTSPQRTNNPFILQIVDETSGISMSVSIIFLVVQIINL